MKIDVSRYEVNVTNKIYFKAGLKLKLFKMYIIKFVHDELL